LLSPWTTRRTPGASSMSTAHLVLWKIWSWSTGVEG